ITLLIGTKCGRVIVAPAVDDARRMLYVKYLVEHDVFHKPFRDFPRVESLADGNGLVSRVVMPQDAARPALRPCQYRLFNLTVKMASIDAREDAIQIVNL